MIPLGKIEPVAEAQEERGPPGPKVFARTFVIPPGLPWDQSQAALLEARHGAPLPIASVVMQVRRLDPWRPNQNARFAAFYVRRAEFRTSFEAEVVIDDRTLTVTFLLPAERRLRLQRLALTGGLACACTAMVLIAITTALEVREQNETRLQRAEQRMMSKSRLVRALARDAEDERAFARISQGERGLDEALADLSWLSGAKDPAARIEGVHWKNGLLAIEAKGPNSPVGLASRQISRSDKPVRPGVWVWGVEPAR